MVAKKKNKKLQELGIPSGKGAIMRAGNIRKAARTAKRQATQSKKAARRASKGAKKTTPKPLPGPVPKITRDWAKRRTIAEIVTPEIARAYLRRNTNNRPLSKIDATAFRDIIINGEWETIPNQGIAFHESGFLADGQHRLRGIVMAGQPVKVYVSYGLTDKELAAIDQGKKRTVAHVIAIQQRLQGNVVKKYGTQRAAVARAMLRGLGKSEGRNRLTRTANVVRWEGLYSEIIEAYVDKTQEAPTRKIYHSGWVAAFCMAAAVHGRPRIDALLERLHSRKFQTDMDPLAAFVRLMENPRTRQISRSSSYYGYAVSAISASLLGQQRQHIRGSTTDFGGADQLREDFYGDPEEAE